MKLNEIFFDTIFEYAWKFKTEKIVPACIKITENYAVQFGEYLDSLTDDDMGNKSIKELLEEFKKLNYE